MGTEATAWLAKLVAVMDSTCTVSGWRVLDPSGVELYSGVFSTGNVGVWAGGSQASHSGTFDIVGRGSPGGGLAQGNTRCMWFSGQMLTTHVDPSFPTGTSGIFFDLVNFLNTSTVIGADIYGTKAVFQYKIDLQINAHFQKRYGL
jgi:hypothetical protein